MTTDTSIGDEDDSKTSGIDDASEVREDDADVTAEDIEEGNDRNVSSDQGNRSGKTNKIKDDAIELGR